MHMKRPLAAAFLVAVMTISACGSPGGMTTSHAAAGGGRPAGSGGSALAHRQHGATTITIMNYGYSGDLTVRAGAHVTVLNKDSTVHTLTDKVNGLFDTGSIAGGSTGSFTAPAQPGRYPFGCTFHPEMSGVLTVVGS